MKTVIEHLGFDINYYTSRHADLRQFTEAQAVNHYCTYGYFEGRMASALSERLALTEKCKSEERVLEIGPFCSPMLKGTNVKYFDVLDKEALIKRAKQIGLDTVNAVDIDYVSDSGDLSIINDKFDAVISSHCIEHQPDLIKHLQQVSALLTENGSYFLIIPDKRFCFDYPLGATNIGEIIEAYLKGEKKHTARSIIEHMGGLHTHNNSALHWKGDHGEVDLADFVSRTRKATSVYENSINKYVDVHAWKFTPVSFLINLVALEKLGYHEFSTLQIFGTPRPSIEFTAILSKRKNTENSNFRIPYRFFMS